MQTNDKTGRVRIQRPRASNPDPLHGTAGPVVRRRGEQSYRERRSRGALACGLRQLASQERARRRRPSAAMLPREAAMFELAKQLDGDAPVATDGINRARALVTDARRSFDNRPGRRTLEAELRVLDGR